PVALGGGATLQGSFGRMLYRLTICPVADTLAGPDVDLPGESVESVVWSGDGTKIYAGTHDDDLTDARMKNLRYFVIDAKTFEATEMKLPEGHSLRDVSADGKLYLTAGPNPKPTVGRPLWVVPADGSDPVRLTDTTEGANCAQFSPDAKTVLACGAGTLKVSADAEIGPGRCPPAKSYFWFDTLSIADGTRSPVLDLKPVKLAGDEAGPQPTPGVPGAMTVPNPYRDYVWRCRWSPDGTRVVYLPRTLPTDFDKLAAAVTVAKRDGTGKKLILDFTHAGNISIDWR